MVRILLLSVVTLVYMAGHLIHPVFVSESSEISPSDTLIHMQRTVCFGTCPAYELTITQKGKVAFIGKQYVKQKGRAESQISGEKMDQLIQEIHESDFMEIPSNPECESRMTDLPSVFLTVNMDGNKHSVSHYHGCRGFEYEEQLYELENAIDSLAGVEKWIGD